MYMKRSELFFALLLVPIDAAMVVLAFILAYYLRSDIGSLGFYDAGIREYLKYSLCLLPVWIALFAANGLYSIKNTSNLPHEFNKIVVATSTAILLFVMLIFFTKTTFFSRLILAFIWAISIFLIFSGRTILRWVRNFLLVRGIGIRNVLLIGNNAASREVSYELSRPSLGYKIIGVVGNGQESGLKVVGEIENLKDLIKENSVDEVILTDSSIKNAKMVNIIETCADYKAGFKYIPDIFALMASNFQPGLIGSIPVMELKSIPLDGWGRIIKRTADIIFSLILLILLSPVYVLIAFLVKATSKGPVLYLHQRVGQDDEVFDFYKFRSMYFEKSDYKGGVYWSTQEDEKTRITPFGKFLRKTNLDELPQLWNILIGDMSFVGPRPEMPKFVEKFEKEIPDYFRRHKVKAGLTGWAQVNGLKGDTSIKERVRYDIYYIENWSLWFDLKIIIKTIWLLIYEIFNGKIEYRSNS